MNCEIVSIGSELLRGQILDTNTAYLAQSLNLIGFNVSLHTSVGDDYDQMKEVISDALTRSDLVIATGGLGPTEDDLTREAIADLTGVPLVFKQELMDQIETVFRVRGYRMPDSNRKQAFIPEDAIPIPNDIGTAPGFMVKKKSKLLVALPGVPKELEYLFTKAVIPYLKTYFHLDRELIFSKVLRITGMGESKVDTQIKDLMNPRANPRLCILSSPVDIRVVITAFAKGPEEAGCLIEGIEGEIKTRLGAAVYGSNDDSLEGVVVNLLRDRGETLSIIETFTGGELTARLNRVPSSLLIQSIIGRDAHQLYPLLRIEDILLKPDVERAVVLAHAIREYLRTSIGLAVVGLLHKTERDYEVDAHVAVTGERVKRSYHWKMGADLPTLQLRGAIIALNTLRLALISWEQPKFNVKRQR
jgi:nicotinamide-nucleotide amidase